MTRTHLGLCFSNCPGKSQPLVLGRTHTQACSVLPSLTFPCVHLFSGAVHFLPFVGTGRALVSIHPGLKVLGGPREAQKIVCSKVGAHSYIH